MHRKIVYITISLFAAGTMNGMDNQVMGTNGRKIFCMLPATESGQYALQIRHVLHNDDAIPTIQNIGNWLMKKRSSCNDTDWPIFVNRFASDIEKTIPMSGSSSEQKKLSKIKDIIKQKAVMIKPGQDCSGLLLMHILPILDMTSKY
jgi:hypothetical protein